MDERRSAYRHVSEDFGLIIPHGGGGLPCRVVDRSESGMRLAVHAADWVPDDFTIEMVASGERLPVRVAWRSVGLVGVETMQRAAA